MKISKLKQIKKPIFFFKKIWCQFCLLLFAFDHLLFIYIYKKLIFQSCVNWNLKLVILYEHLELNKKPHHWFGARFKKKKNQLYYLRKNKNKKTKIET